MASPTYQTNSRYALKPQAHSSHSILLQCLPETGNGRQLLDVGCADGYLSRLFSDRGFAVTAIDAHIPQRSAVPDGITFLEADLDCGLPQVDRKFDFVVCADVLEHLRDPDVLLQHIRSNMSAGGKLMASLPNSGNIYFRVTVLLGRFPAHDRGLFDRTHLHFYTWDGWKDLLNRNGFQIRMSQPSVIPFGLAWPRHPGLAAVLEAVYWVAARTWRNLFAYQFVVVADIDADSESR